MKPARLILLLWLGALALWTVWRPHDPLAVSPARQFQPPSSEHWLGTDRLGRDVFSRTGLALKRTLVQAGLAEIAGFAASLLVAAVVIVQERRVPALAASARALLLALRTLPPFLVALSLAVFLRDSFPGVVAALFALSFIFSQPVYEAELAQAVRHPAVEGAITLGANPGRVVRAYLLPLVLPRLLRYAVLDFASLVAFAALFSFVGLTAPPQPSLGEMLYEARAYLTVYPWLFLAPTGALVLLLVGLWSFKPETQG
ncbi:MAG: ABC transporter permease subunit [Verrucomicrobiales bacterium]|nr:ABC transporter permease subunit [Verrucomicrobiales bacterium]